MLASWPRLAHRGAVVTIESVFRLIEVGVRALTCIESGFEVYCFLVLRLAASIHCGNTLCIQTYFDLGAPFADVSRTTSSSERFFLSLVSFSFLISQLRLQPPRSITISMFRTTIALALLFGAQAFTVGTNSVSRTAVKVSRSASSFIPRLGIQCVF